MTLMRLFLILSMAAVLCTSAQAQHDDLVTWEFELNEEGTALDITATMKGDWVIYSQHTAPDGPLPLEFEFTELKGVELDGAVEELTKPETVMSEMFEVEVSKFKKSAVFKQKFKPTEGERLIKGTVTFMTCDSQQCLPPRPIDFEVK